MDAKIHVSRLGGTATVPPSKSAAHRAVLCAALADGTSHITNIEYSKDIRATLGAAAQLGHSAQGGADVLAVLNIGNVADPIGQRRAQNSAVCRTFAGRHGGLAA